jgi:hypothetical protein
VDATRASAALGYGHAMELRAQDEFPHIPDGEDESPWKDTWWFVARDADADVAVHAHFTLSANRQPPARATVLVKHGGREALEVLRTEATRVGGDEVGNDLLQLRILEPAWGEDKRIRLTAQLAEVSVELDLVGRFGTADINSLCPGVLPARSGGPTGPSAGGVLRHVESAMTFSGSVAWSGEAPTPISGFAIRDRSWGWRKTQAMFRFGWEGFFGHGPDYSVGLGCFRVDDAPGSDGSRASAFIADSGGVHVCTDVQLRLDGTGRPLLVSFTSADGRTITAETVRQGMTAHLPFQDPDSLTENSLMVVQAEHHLDMRDSDGGVLHGLYTTARPRYSDVLAGTTFHTASHAG